MDPLASSDMVTEALIVKWVLGAFIALSLLVVVLVILRSRVSPTRNLNAEAIARDRRRVDDYRRAGMRIVQPFLRWRSVYGVHAGTRFRHFVRSASRDEPALAVVAIATDAPGEFHIQPEDFSTSSIDALGLVKEYQTGDKILDGKLYFSAAPDTDLAKIFGVRGNLDCLRALVAGGFDDLQKSGSQLIVAKPSAELLDIEALQNAVGQLASLRLPPGLPGTEARKRRLPGRWAWYALRAALALLAVVALVMESEARPLLDGWGAMAIALLPQAAALSALTLVAAYFGLKGRSMAAPGYIELLILLPVVTCCFVSILGFANERLDNSVAEVRETRLAKRHVIGTDKRSRYHLEFESWRGRDKEAFKVPQQTYELGRDGQIWQLRVRRGWLGRAWVESMAPRR